MFNRVYSVSEMGKLNFFTYSDNVASFWENSDQVENG